MTGATVCGCGSSDQPSESAPVDPLVRMARFVEPEINWTARQLNVFLDELPDTGLLSLKQGLGLLEGTASTADLAGTPEDQRQIKKQLLWVSSNIFKYPVSDIEGIPYHDLVKWVASKTSVDQEIVKSCTTYPLERAINEQAFAMLWDSLDESRRKELLATIDTAGRIQDHAGVAALGGSAALGVLSATTYFSGFAFYTTMSTVISTIAGWAGVTLPFAAYTGASSIAAFLSGPVGWALLALGGAVGAAMLGRANWSKTMAFIIQLHSLKAASRHLAGLE